LLAKTADELAKNSWRVNNVDATIVAEKPTLKDFIDPMRRQLSWTLGIDIDQVSVKASTADRLGFIGRSEGIAVYTIATVEKI
jgi:2-C-methyl-D-erythritol 2,4-cyclodiphosphate synthase